MERKIGEVFFNKCFEVKLQIIESPFGCRGCYFNLKTSCIKNQYESGYCCGCVRKDCKDVIFQEIKN